MSMKQKKTLCIKYSEQDPAASKQLKANVFEWVCYLSALIEVTFVNQTSKSSIHMNYAKMIKK